MRVALIGCGRWGVHVLRDLLVLGCDVPVLVPSGNSEARARGAGATTIVTSRRKLGDVDGVVVVTPASTHAAVLEEMLPLDVPVYVEKPLCPDPGAAARLVEAFNGRLFVMDKWRYHPGVRALAEIARSGSLGAVGGLRTVRTGWGARHVDVDATWVLAPHDLSIALEVLGAVPRPVAARGSGTVGAGVVLYGLLELGAVWHALEVSDRSPETTRRIELHCDEGVAVLAGGWDNHITVNRSGQDAAGTRVDAPGEFPLLAELRAFVEHLRGGPPPRSSAAEGAAIVEAIATLRMLAGFV